MNNKETIKEETKDIKDNKATTKPVKNDYKKEDFGIEMWLKTKDLRVDADTQRSNMHNHTKKIVENFDPKSFGRITVSKRDNSGLYYVRDGQHRMLTALQLGLEEVPCIVLDISDKTMEEIKKEDAVQFLKINENSSCVSALDKYRVGVQAGIKEWVRVKKVVVDDNGLEVGSSYNCVNAVATIYKYINSSKNEEVAQGKMQQMSTAIRILNNTVGVAGITNISANAMALFVKAYIISELITVEDAIAKFKKVDMKKMILTAQQMKNNDSKGNVITYLAYYLTKEYNNNTRGKKLPQKFEI